MTTLIIGATGGVGAALARSATDRPLILSGRDVARLDALATELGASAQAADLGFESHVSRLFGAVPGSLDTLIYAAGAAHPEPTLGTSGEVTRTVWNANYFGALWTLKYGLKRLGPGGRMYVLGARPELVTARGFGQYAASKAALARLLDIARLEARGVTLTLVLPPAVDTGLWTQVGRAPKGAIPPEQVAQAIWQDRAGETPRAELRVD